MGWAYDRVYEPPRDLKSLEEIVAKLRSENKGLIEVVAKAIYEEETCEWEEAYGKVPRIWRIPNTPWDSNENELCEHERDDYRMMAKAAIVAMNLFMEKKDV
jgi:hypothetical protein